tara:strand:- start:1901 stop:2794 length:894 start_codon:yes stop_codon:yes gene_type:complete
LNNKDIINLLENKINIPEEKFFCSIIGSNPSKGARSPLLWNTTFEKMGLDIKMIPFDCNENHIKKLLQALEKNDFYIGGAIAAPFKEHVFNWLGENITEKSRKIGAVNCIFKENNKLIGTNTDGEAGVISIKKNFGQLNNKNVVILGSGGTAKAIAAYLVPELIPNGKLTIVGRDFEKLQFHKSYKNTQAILWRDIDKKLNEFELIINCTSIGWDNQSTKSPISENLIKLLPNKLKIFDVIYDPNPTLLLSYAKNVGLDVLNGLSMNLEQAVLAYAKVNNMPENLEQIRNHMLSAKK